MFRRLEDDTIAAGVAADGGTASDQPGTSSSSMNGILEMANIYRPHLIDRSAEQLTVLITTRMQREVRRRERQFVRLQTMQRQVTTRLREVEVSRRG